MPLEVVRSKPLGMEGGQEGGSGGARGALLCSMGLLWLLALVLSEVKSWAGWWQGLAGLGVSEHRYSEQDTGTGGHVFRNISTRTSLVVQWLRICLPIQGTRVWSLVLEDPACHRAAKPAHHSYWACALELPTATTEARKPQTAVKPWAVLC